MKVQPVSVRRGFPGDDEDAQRRLIMAGIPSPISDITVINGYFPQGESRDHPTKFPAKRSSTATYRIIWNRAYLLISPY